MSTMKSGCCTICLEPLCKDIQVGHCGHVFHRSCIYIWIDKATTCPLCKQHLDASQLTTLFLNPLDILAEVIKDPSVLRGIDPQLLQLFSNTFEEECSNDCDDDIDLEVLNLNNNKKHRKSNIKLELIQQKIKTATLTEENQSLNTKISQVSKTLRLIEDEKSGLNRKIQSYLKTAQTYEKKYFDSEDKLNKLTINLFKKNQELVKTKQSMDKLLRQQSMYEHIEAVQMGNMTVLHRIESESNNKSREYWFGMYNWVKAEYQKNKSNQEKDKRLYAEQVRKSHEVNEDLRIRNESLSKGASTNLEKAQRYKKHYFDLKEKYLLLRDKSKQLQKKCSEKQESQEQKKEEESDDMKSYHSESCCEEQENIEVKDVTTKENVSETKPVSLPKENSVFSYPNSLNNDCHGFNMFGQRKQSSVMAKYRQMKSRKDNQIKNPFSNGNKKRNFTDFVKGGDGRGGVKTYLGENMNHNNVNRKRRRVVKTSSNNHKNKKSKGNIASFFRQTQ